MKGGGLRGAGTFEKGEKIEDVVEGEDLEEAFGHGRERGRDKGFDSGPWQGDLGGAEGIGFEDDFVGRFTDQAADVIFAVVEEGSVILELFVDDLGGFEEGFEEFATAVFGPGTGEFGAYGATGIAKAMAGIALGVDEGPSAAVEVATKADTIEVGQDIGHGPVADVFTGLGGDELGAGERGFGKGLEGWALVGGNSGEGFAAKGFQVAVEVGAVHVGALDIVHPVEK